jgi:hypothetical protein
VAMGLSPAPVIISEIILNWNRSSYEYFKSVVQRLK